MTKAAKTWYSGLTGGSICLVIGVGLESGAIGPMFITAGLCAITITIVWGIVDA